MAQCPYFRDGKRCPGLLWKESEFSTDLGIINGIDHNQKTEIFICPVCNKKSKRQFKWETYD